MRERDADVKQIKITSDSRSVSEEAICEALSEKGARAFHAAMEKVRNGELCKLPEEARHPLVDMDKDYIKLDGFRSEAVGELMGISLHLHTNDRWSREEGLMRCTADGTIFGSHLSKKSVNGDQSEPCTNYIQFQGRLYKDGTIGLRFFEDPDSKIRTQIVRVIMLEMVTKSLPLEITIDLDDLAEACTEAVRSYGVEYDADDAWRKVKEFFHDQTEVHLHWAPVKEGRKRPSFRSMGILFSGYERIGTKAVLYVSERAYGMFGIEREEP